jgi:PAS domain S-box-containing protein
VKYPVDLPVAENDVLANLCAFVIVLARDGTIRYASDSLFKRTRHVEEDCVGRPFTAAPWWVHTPGMQAEIESCVRDALQGRIADLNLEMAGPSQRITAAFEFKPLRNGDGSVVAVLAEGRDITDQRVIERKLRDAHFRWRTIADCTVDWEFWLHPAGHFMYSSPSCQRITGYGVDDLTQGRTTISGIAFPDDRKKVAELLTGAFSGTTGHSQRFRIVRRDGTVRSVSMSWQPVQGDDGRFLGIRGSVRDVTDMAMAETELQRLLEAYRTLARHFPKGLVALLDNELRFVVCDGPAFRWVGLDPDRIMGKRFDQVFEPALLERVGPMFNRAREGHEVADVLEYNNDTWLVHLTPIRGDDGAIRHVIASAVLGNGAHWSEEEHPTGSSDSV